MSRGIGVEIMFKAPPMVYGPWVIADGPFSTSKACMRPAVGK